MRLTVSRTPTETIACPNVTIGLRLISSFRCGACACEGEVNTFSPSAFRRHSFDAACSCGRPSPRTRGELLRAFFCLWPLKILLPVPTLQSTAGAGPDEQRSESKNGSESDTIVAIAARSRQRVRLQRGKTACPNAESCVLRSNGAGQPCSHAVRRYCLGNGAYFHQSPRENPEC